MANRRGFLLVMILFLTIILATLGLAFLGSRVSQYQSTAQSVAAAQARFLARSGLEDARVKLNHDIGFPSPPVVGQNTFVYSENLLDNNGVFIGTYRVSVDSSLAVGLYYLLTVTSRGEVVPADPAHPNLPLRVPPLASHSYRISIDVSTVQSLINAPTTSPTYFQIVRFDDLGSI